VQFLRLLVLDGPDLFLLEPVFRNEVVDFMALPVSEANELAVGALVSGRAAQAIALLDAAAAKAAAAAASAATPSSRSSPGSTPAAAAALAAAVRVGERQALRATVGWWARDAELVKQKEFYQERRLKEMGLDKPWSPEDGVESTFSAGGAKGNVDWS
jgi:[ribulose-bisphosphate carboxylase]-lysine N-methyltransferase